MHYNDREEIQYVIQVIAILHDVNKECKVCSVTTFFCPFEPNVAHEIENTDDVTFVYIYVYNSLGGKCISLTLLLDDEK